MDIEKRKSVMQRQNTPYKWLFNRRKSRKLSPWLQSSLDELNMKTKKMLKLIDVRADSLPQYAELFHKNREELIKLVNDLHLTHRSLAEKYDHVKFKKFPKMPTQSHDGHSNSSDSENEDIENDEVTNVARVTEVEEPLGHDGDVVKFAKPEMVTNGFKDNEIMKLREEVERLKEEKVEVIRQLSITVMMLKEDNKSIRGLSRDTFKRCI